MLKFSLMNKDAMNVAFRQWKKEQPNEPLSKNTQKKNTVYDWYYAIDRARAIGFVAIADMTSLVPVQLEVTYVYPQYRGQGYTVKIRDALVAHKQLGALSVGKYQPGDAKSQRYFAVAAESGFNLHCGIINTRSNSLLGEVILHTDRRCDEYPDPLLCIPMSVCRRPATA